MATEVGGSSRERKRERERERGKKLVDYGEERKRVGGWMARRDERGAGG